MPFLSLTTNVDIAAVNAESLLRDLSAAIAKSTGKPESVVQIQVAGGVKMLMAGSLDPTVNIDVKSISLQAAAAKTLSAQLTAVAVNALGVRADRVHISFASYAASMWGFNGGTF